LGIFFNRFANASPNVGGNCVVNWTVATQEFAAKACGNARRAANFSTA